VEHIDADRAGRARERAEADLRSDPDNDESKAALQRAEVRLEVAAK
jgi:F0F1-type ATP synthase epsilon subunit